MMGPTIHWELIGRAVEFYRQHYAYVEAPWIVSPSTVELTLPPGHVAHMTIGGALVGSAEQSFVELALRGDLGEGRHMAVTPCFRDDPADELHQQTFVKVELIHLTRQPLPNVEVWDMLHWAMQCMMPLSGYQQDLKIENTPEGRDILLNGIEVGSYGQRSHAGWHWIYGTGLAEPRFSIAAAKSG